MSSGTVAGGSCLIGMEKVQPSQIIDAALEIEAGDRDVTIAVPNDGQVVLTPDAAEVSGIRLLDAADKARRPRR